MKWCSWGRHLRPVAAFGVERGRIDGLSHHCRECRASQARNRRLWRPESHRPQLALKHRARMAASRAGLAALPECQRCQSTDRPLEKHHHAGYDKDNQLNVQWLCRSCHMLTESDLRASAGRARLLAVLSKYL